MEFLTALWLPIILSAVFVFIVSSIMHMVLPFHRSDYAKMDGEDAVLEAMHAQKLAPGHYMFPHAASFKELGTPEMMEKYKRGPVGWMTVLPPGPPTMGKSLVVWFLYSLVVSIFAAYLGSLAMGWGEPYMRVFRVTGAVAVLAYAVTNVTDSVWKGQRWGVTGKFILDGVIYGLVTAGTFAWLCADAA